VKFRLLDLFSGIGGFSLGLERSGGFNTVAFCEIDPFCQKVLKKHWPEVPQYHDIRELTAERLASDGIGVDAICGGFPCQDISVAGEGAGIEGERSGLWSEYARLIGELRPRYAIVENVSALLGRGLDRVLGDLSEIGYDAEWDCIPAGAIGAPIIRDRVWITAFPSSFGLEGRLLRTETLWRSATLVDRDIWNEIPTDIGHNSRNGVPYYVDQIRGLGNAVVPQIPELIGRAILESQ
jgi:DNA (cytosine-5)-methyltransferase 1